jgi:uncharacterized protein HemX
MNEMNNVVELVEEAVTLEVNDVAEAVVKTSPVKGGLVVVGIALGIGAGVYGYKKFKKWRANKKAKVMSVDYEDDYEDIDDDFDYDDVEEDETK